MNFRSNSPRLLKTAIGSLIFLLASPFTSSHNLENTSIVKCSDIEFRANSLTYTSIEPSVSSLSIEIPISQTENISIGKIYKVIGNCQAGIKAYRPNYVEFDDGKVFLMDSNGRLTYSPKSKDLANLYGGPMGLAPKIKDAQFIMSSRVDGAFDKTSIDVGLWKKKDYYFVSAFIRTVDGFGIPIELIRSSKRIKSVTFFPSTDSASGTLGIVESENNQNLLISLYWNHSYMSKEIRAAKR